ncbi:head completion adaptor [Vibrio phage 1.152.O._10N.222.46.E1]|uniref:Head completion adaptor n=5 Tax=Nahantvirus 49C7 TaxID=2846601 RepID=A0A2I7RBB5_9CAUD|nr:virion structural protein [Vibrio phage 1.026.O._10N.222.49.C7]AUR82492.1 head completion adaptor [Vibrio phage 1.025.O._10N.222.46.B6]AUR90742.1 head completion adaptor [Vibrio phage 1.150.O._10N.222.46.A6]AUR90914.1 head completion adaptor [Vibrio phage 1.152.O._10N.222.46.E1]AUS02383.1 head completion adaptor [Vibrio phage 2.130.O._10N.222.46.C2]AUR82600.1 head completion adaptor [Vibrio phage 1.026.O._10N.222.49.C7]
MKLSELFSYLTYGELSNLKVGGKECGGIYPKYSDEVLSFVKQGLTDLHTRFPLKQNEVVVQQFDHITEYVLRYKYAESNLTSTEPYKWIMDTKERPFQSDIISIEEIYDEVGNELYLNYGNQKYSIYTPAYDIVQVPYPYADNAMAVIYKADHPTIDLGQYKPEDVEVELPVVLVRALILYVASLAHSAIGSPEGVQTGFAKMQEYQALCMELELRGVVAKENWTNEQIGGNGWV